MLVEDLFRILRVMTSIRQSSGYAKEQTRWNLGRGSTFCIYANSFKKTPFCHKQQRGCRTPGSDQTRTWHRGCARETRQSPTADERCFGMARDSKLKAAGHGHSVDDDQLMICMPLLSRIELDDRVRLRPYWVKIPARCNAFREASSEIQPPPNIVLWFQESRGLLGFSNVRGRTCVAGCILRPRKPVAPICVPSCQSGFLRIRNRDGETPQNNRGCRRQRHIVPPDPICVGR